MFRAILATQWKWTRGIVLLCTILAFTLPLLAYSSARQTEGVRSFVLATQRWGHAYALLAAALGLLVALAAWQHDHQGRHVYALSLPISRARYAGLRFRAGATCLVPPMLALLAGALLVTVAGEIPQGLHPYPVALTLRFALATGVAYAVFFAIASSTPQASGIILGAVAALFFTQYLLSIVGSNMDILAPVGDFIFVRPGILSVFTGRWMLIDV